MDKLEQFKTFVSTRPYIVKKVHEKKNTWQELYEIYDIYGETHEAFNEVKVNVEENDSSSTSSGTLNWSKLFNSLQNIDMNKLSEGLNNIKKVVDIFGEFSNRNTTETNNIPNDNYYSSRRPFRRYND